MRVTFCSTLVSLLVALAATTTPAAEPAGLVTGTLKDGANRPLAGARVRLQTGTGQVVATTVADDEGRFAFRDVPPGTYELRIWHETLAGSAKKVTVAPGQAATVDFVLK